MARGPLADPAARRRNAPTIPTTSLPAAGCADPPPACPYELASAGAAWWEWAWRLPQACAWSVGDLYVVARRARLEDDVAALGFGEDLLPLEELLAGCDDEALRQVEWALGALKRSATGKLALEKEMRELDGKLGLTPEALARLRWSIVADDVAGDAEPRSSPSTNVRNLRAVDPALAESG